MKKTFLAAAVALGALAISVPAHAEPRGNDYNYNQRGPERSDYRGPDRDVHRSEYPGDYRGQPQGYSREALFRISDRIDRGFQSGRLTPRAAERLNWQVNDLRQRARHYWRTDGIDWREQRDLDNRYFSLRDAVRYQMRDEDRRWSDNGGPRRY